MKKNKLMMIMIILLVTIALVGAIAIVVIMKMTGEDKEKEPTIDEVLESSVDIPQMTANLASDDFIRISFKIQTDSVEAKEELQKRDFQVKNIIILELSEKTSEELKGKEGQMKLEDDLKSKVSEIMQDGNIEHVYITESLLQ